MITMTTMTMTMTTIVLITGLSRSYFIGSTYLLVRTAPDLYLKICPHALALNTCTLLIIPENKGCETYNLLFTKKLSDTWHVKVFE